MAGDAKQEMRSRVRMRRQSNQLHTQIGEERLGEGVCKRARTASLVEWGSRTEKRQTATGTREQSAKLSSSQHTEVAAARHRLGSWKPTHTSDTDRPNWNIRVVGLLRLDRHGLVAIVEVAAALAGLVLRQRS